MEPFVPQQLPLTCVNWEAHVTDIGKANAALARYDTILHTIVNPNLLLSPLTTVEAVLSSRIEGTQATLDDVLEYDAAPDEHYDKRLTDDYQEIKNYRDAISYALEKLKTHPITLNVIKDIHAILLNSVRGQNKTPGEFRRIQNHIGAPNTTIEQATYVPPTPDRVLPAMQNWEGYIHQFEKDTLVQLAIIKAQFEIIHPFLDGNGRIGRILIPLFLYSKEVLSSPMFYLSSYLESHRDLYYDRLRAITERGQWNEWIQFFLQAVTIQAMENTSKADAIRLLCESMQSRVAELTKSQFSVKAVEALFLSPVFTISSFISKSNIPKASAIRIIGTLREHKILIDVRHPKGRRSGIFAFKELHDIIR